MTYQNHPNSPNMTDMKTLNLADLVARFMVNKLAKSIDYRKRQFTDALVDALGDKHNILIANPNVGIYKYRLDKEKNVRTIVSMDNYFLTTVFTIDLYNHPIAYLYAKNLLSLLDINATNKILVHLQKYQQQVQQSRQKQRLGLRSSEDLEKIYKKDEYLRNIIDGWIIQAKKLILKEIKLLFSQGKAQQIQSALPEYEALVYVDTPITRVQREIFAKIIENYLFKILTQPLGLLDKYTLNDPMNPQKLNPALFKKTNFFTLAELFGLYEGLKRFNHIELNQLGISNFVGLATFLEDYTKNYIKRINKQYGIHSEININGTSLDLNGDYLKYLIFIKGLKFSHWKANIISFSETDKQYELTYNIDGINKFGSVFKCNCPDYTYRRGPKGSECKHITWFLNKISELKNNR